MLQLHAVSCASSLWTTEDLTSIDYDNALWQNWADSFVSSKCYLLRCHVPYEEVN